jgi:hypothetical protein
MRHWTRDYVTARIGPSILLALLPLPTAFLVLPLFLLVGDSPRFPIVLAPILMLLLWALVLVATVRALQRHWIGARVQPTWSLFGAGVVALASWGVLMELGAPWQDMMSMPHPTPTMVAMDTAANFGPLLASAAATWLMLVVCGQGKVAEG